MLDLYLFQLLNGIGLGMIYFLTAVGLSITFGLLDFVSFAHGAFFLLGSYLCFMVVDALGNFWIAFAVAPLIVAGIAWLTELILIRRTYQVSYVFQILITLGLAIVIQEVIIMIWGSAGKHVNVPQAFSGVVVLWGGFMYPKYRLFVIACSALIGLILWVLLERTTFGALVRAGSEDRTTTALLGTNIFRLFSVTFTLGALLAAVAGVLAVPIRGAQPFEGTSVLVLAFVVVVIGGMGSFLGALAGGLVVGIVQTMITTFWPPGAHLMIFAAMAIIIIALPRGLLGRA